jgi:hypothetical protein
MRNKQHNCNKKILVIVTYFSSLLIILLLILVLHISFGYIFYFMTLLHPLKRFIIFFFYFYVLIKFNSNYLHFFKIQILSFQSSNFSLFSFFFYSKVVSFINNKFHDIVARLQYMSLKSK